MKAELFLKTVTSHLFHSDDVQSWFQLENGMDFITKYTGDNNEKIELHIVDPNMDVDQKLLTLQTDCNIEKGIVKTLIIHVQEALEEFKSKILGPTEDEQAFAQFLKTYK